MLIYLLQARFKNNSFVELVEKSDYKSAENQTYQNDYKNLKYD